MPKVLKHTLLFLIVTGTVWAQGPPPGVGGRLSWKTRASLLYLDGTEVEGGAGSYSVLRSQVSLSYDMFTLGYSHWDFAWDNVAQLPFGDGVNDPWKRFEKVSLSARKIIPSREHGWAYVIGGSISSYFEDDLGDSPGATVYGGMSFGSPRSSQWTVGGVFIYHPVNTTVWPMIAYTWRNEAGWQASVGFPRTAIGLKKGPLTYSFGFLADRAMVGLADTSAVAPDGYLEVSNIMVSAGIAYSPIPPLTLSLKLARSIINEVTFYDSKEHELSDYDVDRAFGVQLELSMRF